MMAMVCKAKYNLSTRLNTQIGLHTDTAANICRHCDDYDDYMGVHKKVSVGKNTRVTSYLWKHSLTDGAGPGANTGVGSSNNGCCCRCRRSCCASG